MAILTAMPQFNMPLGKGLLGIQIGALPLNGKLVFYNTSLSIMYQYTKATEASSYAYMEIDPGTYLIDVQGGDANTKLIGYASRKEFTIAQGEFKNLDFGGEDGTIYEIGSPTSSDINIIMNPLVDNFDMCLIGPGGNGGSIEASNLYAIAGGGAGGYMTNVYGVQNLTNQFTINIGSGGSGNPTICSLGYQANAGGNGAGATSDGTYPPSSRTLGGSGGTGGGTGVGRNMGGTGTTGSRAGGSNGSDGGSFTYVYSSSRSYNYQGGTGDGQNKYVFGLQEEKYLYCGGGGGLQGGTGGSGGGGDGGSQARTNSDSTYGEAGKRYGAGGGASGRPVVGSYSKGASGAVFFRTHF